MAYPLVTFYLLTGLVILFFALSFRYPMLQRREPSGLITRFRTYALSTQDRGRICRRLLVSSAGEALLVGNDMLFCFGRHGQRLWQKEIGYGANVSLGKDGCFYVTGITPTDIFMRQRYAMNGKHIESMALPGTILNYPESGYVSATIDDHGNIICYDPENAAIIEADGSKGISWRLGLGGVLPKEAGARSLTVDGQDRIYLAGTVLADLCRPFVVRVDPDGRLAWVRIFRGGPEVSTTDVVADQTGHVYVAGYARGSATGGTFLAKFDPGGALEWQNIVPCPGPLDQDRIAVDSRQNVYVTDGESLCKVSRDGRLLWVKGEFDLGRAVMILTVALIVALCLKALFMKQRVGGIPGDILTEFYHALRGERTVRSRLHNFGQ